MDIRSSASLERIEQLESLIPSDGATIDSVRVESTLVELKDDTRWLRELRAEQARVLCCILVRIKEELEKELSKLPKFLDRDEKEEDKHRHLHRLATLTECINAVVEVSCFPEELVSHPAFQLHIFEYGMEVFIEAYKQDKDVDIQTLQTYVRQCASTTLEDARDCQLYLLRPSTTIRPKRTEEGMVYYFAASQKTMETTSNLLLSYVDQDEGGRYWCCLAPNEAGSENPYRIEVKKDSLIELMHEVFLTLEKYISLRLPAKACYVRASACYGIPDLDSNVKEEPEDAKLYKMGTFNYLKHIPKSERRFITALHLTDPTTRQLLLEPVIDLQSGDTCNFRTVYVERSYSRAKHVPNRTILSVMEHCAATPSISLAPKMSDDPILQLFLDPLRENKDEFALMKKLVCLKNGKTYEMTTLRAYLEKNGNKIADFKVKAHQIAPNRLAQKILHHRIQLYEEHKKQLNPPSV